MVRSLGVVPLDPLSNGSAGFGEVAEVVLPNTLLLETAKEALHEPVLLRRLGSHELLAQTVVVAGGAKAPALEDQAIVAAYQRRRTVGTQRTEPRQASLLERTFGFLRATAQSELKTSDLAVVTIYDRGQMSPAVSSAWNVRDIDGPPLVAPLCAAPKSLSPRAWRHHALMEEPALLSVRRQPSPLRPPVYAQSTVELKQLGKRLATPLRDPAASRARELFHGVPGYT